MADRDSDSCEKNRFGMMFILYIGKMRYKVCITKNVKRILLKKNLILC